MTKILIATPTRGALGMLHVGAAIDITSQFAKRGISFDWLPEGSSPCWIAREKIVHYFLSPECDATHLFFFDDDTSVRGEDVLRLIDADKDVCGIAYRKRLRDMQEHEYTIQIGDWEQEPVDGMLEVTRMGTGAMLIKRRALAAMAGYYSELSYESPVGDRYHGLFRETVTPGFVSEDYSFCDRWTAMGGKIFCLLDADTGHQGATTWFGTFANNWPHMKRSALQAIADQIVSAEEAAVSK